MFQNGPIYMDKMSRESSGDGSGTRTSLVSISMVENLSVSLLNENDQTEVRMCAGHCHRVNGRREINQYCQLQTFIYNDQSIDYDGK